MLQVAVGLFLAGAVAGCLAAPLPSLPRPRDPVVSVELQSGRLDAITVGRTAVWAVGGRRLYRIDPQRAAVVATIAVGKTDWRWQTPMLAVDEEAVWLVQPADDTVLRVDPETNRVAATIRVGPNPVGVAVGEGALWVANFGVLFLPGDGSVSRIDPRTNQVSATIPLAGKALGITSGEGAVWVRITAGVVRIDPRTNQVVATIPCHACKAPLVAGGGAVWASGGVVSRIDSETNQVVSTIPIAEYAFVVAANAEGVWVAEPAAVSRIDPQTNQKTATTPVTWSYRITQQPVAWALGDRVIWIVDHTRRAVQAFQLSQ